MSETTNEVDINTPDELDVSSVHFNPLRALYDPNYKITEKAPKVLYQNVAAFESALSKFGIWQLNKRQKDNNGTAKATKSSNPFAKQSTEQEPESVRRFEPHQMPIEMGPKQKCQRNLYTHMASTEGPLALLQKYLPAVQEQTPCRTRLRVYLRKEHSIGGHIEGDLVAYDKQWNILLKNAVEIWQRRKHKYGEQKICGTPAAEECSERLRQLGIALPSVQVKSLNRKNVQLRRELPQLMVRGENVALITFIINSKE